MAVKGSPICFVCLAGVESNHDNVNGSEFDLYMKFIQVAQNYLKIPLTSLTPLLSVSKTNTGDEMFCETCVKVVRQICNSYLELVEVELRLSWKLGELEKLMENSLNSERTRRLANNLGIPDAADLEKIRELLSVRCEHMSQKFQPQLVVTREETLSASFHNAANFQTGFEASHSQNIKKEVENSPENSDTEWNLSADDEVVSNADEMSATTTTTTYNIILIDSQIKTEEDDDKNSVSMDGSECSSSSEDDANSSRSAFRARKIDKFHAMKVSKSDAGDEKLGWQCNFCWRSFPTDESLTRHIQHRHANPRVKCPGKGTFPCEVEGCHQKYESHLKLNTHLKEHTQELLFCKVCGWGFVDANLLQLHELVHVKPLAVGGPRRLCPKPNCGLRFPSIAALQNHYNVRHGDSLKRFSCSECPHVSTSSKALYEHKRIHHLGKVWKSRKPLKPRPVSLVSCEVEGCSEQFKSHHKLNSHLETHSESINFCQDCGFGFIDVNLLRLHELIHIKSVKVDGMKYARYCCPEVGCSFHAETIVTLQDHYNSRHGYFLKRFKCVQCEYSCKTSRGLRKHVQHVHNEPNKKPKQYPDKKRLKKCVPCGLQFANTAAFRRHRSRLHIRKFCEICKQAFTGQMELTKHLSLTHSKKEKVKLEI